MQRIHNNALFQLRNSDQQRPFLWINYVYLNIKFISSRVERPTKCNCAIVMILQGEFKTFTVSDARF